MLSIEYVCQSFSGRKEKSEKESFGEDASFNWGRIRSYDQIVLAKMTEMEIQLWYYFCIGKERPTIFSFPFLGVRGQNVYKVYDLYSILVNEIIFRNMNYCYLSPLLPDYYLLMGQSFLGSMTIRLKIQ